MRKILSNNFPHKSDKGRFSHKEARGTYPETMTNSPRIKPSKHVLNLKGGSKNKALDRMKEVRNRVNKAKKY